MAMTNSDNSERPEQGLESTNTDIVALLRFLWTARFAMIATLVLASILAVVVTHLTRPQYKSVLLVTAAESEVKSGIGDLLGRQASGLLSGLSGSAANSTTSFMLYIDALKSRAIAERLAKNQTLLHQIFSSQWDPVQKQWHPPPETLFDSVYGTVLTALGSKRAPWEPPGGGEIQTFIDKLVVVEQSPSDPMVTISITLPDRDLANSFLQDLHETTDSYLKSNYLARSHSYIAYLTSALAQTSSSEVRSALIQTLADQEKTAMMASSDLPFAAQPFGPPFADKQPVSPRPSKMLAEFVGVAFVVAAILAFFEVSFFMRLNAILGDWWGRSVAPVRRRLSRTGDRSSETKLNVAETS
jgi:hypothetical protein